MKFSLKFQKIEEILEFFSILARILKKIIGKFKYLGTFSKLEQVFDKFVTKTGPNSQAFLAHKWVLLVLVALLLFHVFFSYWFLLRNCQKLHFPLDGRGSPNGRFVCELFTILIIDYSVSHILSFQFQLKNHAFFLGTG